MGDIQSITSIWTALVAGLITSLHCSVMCGPLACMVTSPQESKWSQSSLAAIYQISRIISYTIIGAIAGGVGMIALGWVDIYHNSLARFFPWLLVLFFFMVATRLDHFFPKPSFLAKPLAKVQLKLKSLSPPVASLGVGTLTPLLPCAPLYAVFTLALMTQSPIRGAEFLLGFGLGTLPLLWIVQQSYVRWKLKMNPLTIQRLQRSVAFIVFLVLGYRLYLFETGPNGFFCATQ